LPGLIDLYEAHKKDREKFEILAFHDGTVKDFADLDTKLVQTRKRYWGGRDLPFPILLDATGQTIKDWGIRAFPTTLLIDPEGKLVGEAGEEKLAEKLPSLPMSVRVAKALDRSISLGVEDPKLGGMCKILSGRSQLSIRLDAENLKAVGITPDTQVPLTMTGALSLRSWLALLLEANGLTYEQDDKGLVIRSGEPGLALAQLSAVQRASAKRIEKSLDQKVSFDFKDKPLSEVVRFLDSRINEESIILSPRDRKAGRLDPKTLVSGSAKDVSFREALKKLLDPIGVSYTIRDEVIVLTAKMKTTPGK
jgi:hypothetical protein